MSNLGKPRKLTDEELDNPNMLFIMVGLPALGKEELLKKLAMWRAGVVMHMPKREDERGDCRISRACDCCCKRFG